MGSPPPGGRAAACAGPLGTPAAQAACRRLESDPVIAGIAAPAITTTGCSIDGRPVCRPEAAYHGLSEVRPDRVAIPGAPRSISDTDRIASSFARHCLPVLETPAGRRSASAAIEGGQDAACLEQLLA